MLDVVTFNKFCIEEFSPYRVQNSLVDIIYIHEDQMDVKIYTLEFLQKNYIDGAMIGLARLPT